MNTWRIAAKGLLERKTLTTLALIGLVLGVATVVTLISISTGIQAMVTDRTSQTKGVTIMEADATMGPILSQVKLTDLNKISGIAGVRNVCPRVIHLIRSIDGKYAELGGGMSSFAMAYGVMPEREVLKRVGPLPTTGELIKGRFLTPSDRRSVVVGKVFADGHKKVVGSTVDIDGSKFHIVGIFETGVKQIDMQVLMPIAEAQRLEGLDSGVVRMAFVEVEDTSQLSQMTLRIGAVSTHIEAISTEQFGQMIGGIISTVAYFLWAISGIAAAVAGVNIANTMLMSILEREQELGVMRAIGWTGTDVIKLVMAESMLLGLAGGVLGLAVGLVAVEIAKNILGINMLVDATLAIEACLYAIGIGIIGGAYPAWRASRMNPLDAIKGE